MTSLLLDEMFSGLIAEQLRAKGHDVIAVVANPALVGLSDDQILTHATGTGRALVTANIKDFMPLDARYRASSQTHRGLILVSAKTFPQDRNFTAALIGALSILLTNLTRSSPARSSFSCASNRSSAPSALVHIERAGNPGRRHFRECRHSRGSWPTEAPGRCVRSSSYAHAYVRGSRAAHRSTGPRSLPVRTGAHRHGCRPQLRSCRRLRARAHP